MVMEHLDLLQGWLAGFPGWQEALTDTTEDTPGSCGLFPQGVEVRRQEDVLGNLRLSCTERYLLRRHACRNEAAARWLQEFQAWVNSQTQFPALGERCRVTAEKGRLVSTSQAGMATYELMLTCDYGKELANGED